MRIRIENVTLITPTGLVPQGAVDAENGVITAVYDAPPPTPAASSGILCTDGAGLYAAPGFVDIHLHGGGGVEFMNASPEQIRTGCAAHARHGATTLLPTTLAAPPELTLSMIRAVRAAQKITTECTIAGVHLEGPFLSPAQSGAQSPDALALPAPELWNRLLDEWPGGVRMMGAAPELPGALELGDELAKRGVLASIGHTDATYEDIARAVAHGYTHMTHFYSGMSGLTRREGYRVLGAIESGYLLDELRIELIADGIHLPPELLRMILKCKQHSSISLVTDAMRGAGLPDGPSVLGSLKNGMQVIVEDGIARMPDHSGFAGSVATTDRLVRVMHSQAGLPLWEAVRMASLHPAQLLNIADRTGSIAPGKDADLVLFEEGVRVRQVLVSGQPMLPDGLPV